MKALLIIDMQKVSFTPKSSRYKADEVIECINKLADLFRLKSWPVVFIQHNGAKEKFCVPGTTEWQLLDELTVSANDTVIAKTANDAFYSTTLDRFLKELSINELVVTGCATDFCVDATVKSALTHEYSLQVIGDGHTTADREQVNAKTLIAYFNWLWTVLTPTKATIEVVPYHEFIKSMKDEA